MTVRKVKFISGFAVIVACLVFLVVSSSQKMSMYYLTVTELEARETEFVNKRIKLAGKVTPGTIRKLPDRIVEFEIWEPLEGAAFSTKRQVVYAGIVPDTFRDEADVVLEGEVGGNGRFRADTLLAKCPSKYEGQSYEEIKESYSR
ncbi:MAG: cytochrome c maturation protein CcmE [Gemmatimonadota bacterium]|nr:cytochrome c maturation protein CcmE [Gemmatimonadota bacterium]